MPTFRPKPSDFEKVQENNTGFSVLKTDVFTSFDLSLLGLGDISQPAQSTDAIAAVFDLQGFTDFGKQIEPHLSVPVFLGAFLTWLFKALREEHRAKDHPQGVRLWSPLPFFVKFMGDGLLALWECGEKPNANVVRNIIAGVSNICRQYVEDFYPTLARQVVDPPPLLRAGVARGTVLSVGNGNDFVGSCINMAARLQKLPGLTFAFNRRGIDLESEPRAKFFKEKIVILQVAVRGIGDHELIGALKSEYDALNKADKKTYKLVGSG